MNTQESIQKTVSEHPIVLFMKGTSQFPMCGFSGKVIQILKACKAQHVVTVNVLDNQDIREGIKIFSSWPTIPQLYIKGEFVGGCDIVSDMYESGDLQTLLDSVNNESNQTDSLKH